MPLCCFQGVCVLGSNASFSVVFRECVLSNNASISVVFRERVC